MTPIPHTQMSSRSSHPDSSPRGFVECYSAQQVSIPFWDLPCQRIPASPACCWQSALQAWWAATGGQVGAYFTRFRAPPALGVAGTCAAHGEMHVYRWRLELETPCMASEGPDQALLSSSGCDWCPAQVTINKQHEQCVEVQHGLQREVANSSLAGHIEVVITQDLRVSSILVGTDSAGSAGNPST